MVLGFFIPPLRTMQELAEIWFTILATLAFLLGEPIYVCTIFEKFLIRVRAGILGRHACGFLHHDCRRSVKTRIDSRPESSRFSVVRRLPG